MNKNISVIGLGQVGLCTSVCFAAKGNKVRAFDMDRRRVKLVDKGVPPFYEPRLEMILKKVIREGNLEVFNGNEEAVLGSDISFITVGTPLLPNGEINLELIRSCARQTGKALRGKNGFHLVVVKSTVIPGSTENVIRPLLESDRSIVDICGKAEKNL